MRLLLVHNRYQDRAPSGENTVVDDELKVLGDAGHDVVPFLAESDSIDDFGPVRRAALTITPSYSRVSTRRFARLLEDHRPDLVHVHNVYPLISPQVIRQAKHAGVPVVHSVHNYRMTCANGTFFRDGRVCTDCMGRRVGWPAVLHGCYRDAASQSAVLAAAMAVHRPTWAEVDRYFVLHEFGAEQLRLGGVPADRIRLKHNMVPDAGPPKEPGDGFVYAGRLDTAKGLATLIDAWLRSGLGHHTTLTIAGDGPLHDFVESRARRVEGLRFVGRVTRSGVLDLIDEAAAVVVPSQWFEGAPLLIAEGMSRGRPAVVHRIGGLPTLIDDDRGWVSDPEPAALARALVTAHETPVTRRHEMSQACRAHFEAHLTPARVLDRLETLYEEVLADTGRPRAAPAGAPPH